MSYSKAAQGMVDLYTVQDSNSEPRSSVFESCIVQILVGTSFSGQIKVHTK